MGGIYCVLAAIGYSVVNACLRMLSVQSDQICVLFVKESVTVAVVGPWLVYQAWRGRSVFPSRRAVAALVVVGLATQLLGNLPTIWAFSLIGLTVALPVMSGINLVTGAVLGRVFLGEAVSVRSAVAIGLLIVAVILLSLGAERTNQSIAETANVATGAGWVALAIGAAALAGVVYCVLGVVIRRSVTGVTSPAVVVFIVTAMGTLSTGPIGLLHNGLAGVTGASGWELSVMLIAGAMNLFAFLAVSRGLKWTTIARANVLGASQVAMGAVVGMTLFHEPGSPWLVLGVVLTIVGMILIGRPAHAEPETPETPI